VLTIYYHIFIQEYKPVRLLLLFLIIILFLHYEKLALKIFSVFNFLQI
jgi:hypothetical protein